MTEEDLQDNNNSTEWMFYAHPKFNELSPLERAHIKLNLAIASKPFRYRETHYVTLPSGKVTGEAFKASKEYPEKVVLLNGEAYLNGLWIGGAFPFQNGLFTPWEHPHFDKGGEEYAQIALEELPFDWISEEIPVANLK